MFLKEYLKSRLQRSFSIVRLGPNEARLIYDSAIGFGAAAGTAGFFFIFFNQIIEWWFVVAPPALVGLNGVLGIYSKLRTAAGRVKAAVLMVSLLIVSAALALLTGNIAGAVLWGMLAGPPLILARLFLALPQSKHKNLAVMIIKQRGAVLVTGGAGYIGSTLVDLLLESDYKVRVLDRLMYGRESLKDFEKNQNFELIHGDVTDIAKLTEAMKGVSAVVHLAGLVGDPACAVDPDFTRQMNIISTSMVKNVGQSMGVYRLIFASSCSVYGVSEKEVDEEDAPNPVSLYAQSKIDSENELLSFVPDVFFVTILRFSTVFGHSRRARFDLVANLFTAQAMNEGVITLLGPHQWRPFVHVRDLARAILMVLKANPVTVQSQVFNVGDNRMNMTILQLAETVKSVVEKNGRKVSISVKEDFGDQRNYAVSFKKINRILGFEAATLMEEGIQEMVENFKQGRYDPHYEQIYSNVAMTEKALTEFYDPIQAMTLYAPLKRQK